MLPITSIFYIFLLVIVCFGSIIYHPFIGTIGYLATYCVSPPGKWWGEFLYRMDIHYGQIIFLTIMVGAVIHRRRLKFKKYLVNQEILLILFLGIIWLSIPLGLGFNSEDTNAIKMTKVVIIILMASHIITDFKKYEIMLWALIIAGLYLGVETYQAPDWTFAGGRLDRGIGGSDFAEGNFLGAHYAMLLPFIGVMFLKGGWKSKIICLLSGVFVTNSIILCRSRGVFLAIIAGVFAAILFALPGKRLKIMTGMTILIVGSFFITDPGFWSRMGEIKYNEAQMDLPSRGRMRAWEAAFSMAADHPLGIGEANFTRVVGSYNESMTGMDTHNTFLRCLAELGVQGLFIYLLLIVNAFNTLRKLRTRVKGLSNEADFLWQIYGLTVSMVVFICCGFFITHTYIEELYWLLMFPVFLKRSVENQKGLSIGIVDQRLAGGVQQI